MGAFGSKLEEIEEFEKAQQEMERPPEERKQKRSMRDKLRTRILRSDPRSATDGLDRTPIAINKQTSVTGAANAGGANSSVVITNLDTPENAIKTLSLDPRSPGEIDRTPIQVEEPVRRRVLAGDECETPVRAATVHHNNQHQPTAATMELAARSPLIIDNGPSDESGIAGLSPIAPVSSNSGLNLMLRESSAHESPKTIDITGLDSTKGGISKVEGGGVQMRTDKGQPSRILQERIRSAIQSQLIPSTVSNTPQAASELDESDISVHSSNDVSLVI
eukprot:TRINITY_DN10491_c0_g1_i2.p1 TRINITY_DN10491_c0_g1~~TRINITY_DN10491_c0_g1_i2.p1  ORF type:complete len:277 (+),score=60.42 TRINITY_DN10491_c0_g1_i2:77-907(+)